MFSTFEAAARHVSSRNIHFTSLSNNALAFSTPGRANIAVAPRLSLIASPSSNVVITPNTLPSGWRNASTRSRRVETDETDNGPRPPRFLRRQELQKSSKPKDEREQKDSPGFAGSTYNGPKKLLDPYTLVNRLKALCETGKIDDAVAMLKNSPRDAMNTPVWNTLMWECMKRQRFQLAYRLYADMKRRGLSPTTRTFQTLFTGLSKIEQWSSYPTQLENARSLYEAFQRHITSLQQHDAQSSEITATPLALYIKILGDAGQYQEIFDVFHALDSDGPFAPDAHIYTAMFQALANTRHALSGKGITAPDHWDAKVASDARLLWTQLSKTSKAKRCELADAFTATTAISALSKGVKEDHDLAFKIVEEYFGLHKDESKAGSGRFKLAPQSFGAILKLCNASAEYQTALQFFQQVKTRPEAIGGMSILDRPHMEEILKARYMQEEGDLGHASLQLLQWMLRQEKLGHGAHIRPAASTFNLVLSACWKGSDWTSAATTFGLMTGYHPEDFQDGAVAETPRFDKRERGRNLLPTAEAMCSLMRAALSTKQRRYIRQCLRILSHIGVDHITTPKRADDRKPSGKEVRNTAFYGSKLAIAVSDAMKVISIHQSECSPGEIGKWHSFEKRCRQELDKSKKSDRGYIPTNLKDERPQSPRPRRRTF